MLILFLLVCSDLFEYDLDTFIFGLGVWLNKIGGALVLKNYSNVLNFPLTFIIKSSVLLEYAILILYFQF